MVDSREKTRLMLEALDEIVHDSAPMLSSILVNKLAARMPFKVCRSMAYYAIQKMKLHKMKLNDGKKGRPKVMFGRVKIDNLVKIHDAACWVASDAFRPSQGHAMFYKYVFMGPDDKYSVYVAPCCYNTCASCGPHHDCYGARNCPLPVFRNYLHHMENGSMVVVVL